MSNNFPKPLNKKLFKHNTETKGILSTYSVPKPLQGKPFTYNEARNKGLTQYAVQKLLDAGIIERIEHGLYRSMDVDLSDEEIYRHAIKRVGKPAVVCLLSALSYYELTDVIPKQVWLMVPKEKRIKSSSVKLYRASDPSWKVGIESKNGYSITSIERTIVDALTLKALVPNRLGIDALKSAISNKKTSANKVLKIASDLGVKHRVLPYIEALS
jgi:predicted transcriptional regulator of viral defense system